MGQLRRDALLGVRSSQHRRLCWRQQCGRVFGSAWFIEAYDGYIEADYAFVHDDVGGHRSYHNLSVAYTRRYFMRVSNSIRYITNFGQSLPSDERRRMGT
ncbi:MAG: hypothetical protein R3C56_06050 [Pirellulaceae bacterium]